jgi:hypothetical protein
LTRIGKILQRLAASHVASTGSRKVAVNMATTERTVQCHTAQKTAAENSKNIKKNSLHSLVS